MMKLICSLLGTLFLALGLLGVILPVLPTVPFIMLALVLYARASKRLYEYFLSKAYIQKIVHRTLTRKERVKVMALLGFWFLVIGYLLGIHLFMVLVVVWIFHLFYFFVYFEKIS